MRISDWSADVCSSDLHQVLYPMNDERLAGRSGVELAFHAQDTVAMAVQERRQPDGESGPVDIAIQRQHEGGCLMGVPRALDLLGGPRGVRPGHATGRAACRERVCQEV